MKLAPHLKLRYLDPSHYEKMNVSSAVAVLNHAVAAAIRVLVNLGHLGKESLTTAWFLEQVDQWFSFMSSRSISTGMSCLNENKHGDAVNFLQKFARLMSAVSIRNQNQRDCFKPVQAGVMVSTASAIAVQSFLLQEHKFKFVMLGRLSQDALENLFSCVRAKNPVPRALEFKLTLRLIMLSQYFRPSRKGSYNISDCTDLLEFVELRKGVPREASCNSSIDVEDELDMTEDTTPMGQIEVQSLCYVAGYVTRSVSSCYSLCAACRRFLQDDKVTDSDDLLGFKSYRGPNEINPLCRPSKKVFRLLQCADKVFRQYEHKVLNVPLRVITQAVLQSTTPDGYPSCHNIRKKLVDKFLALRMRIALRKMNNKQKTTSSKCGSKSVGMRVLADNVK